MQNTTKTSITQNMLSNLGIDKACYLTDGSNNPILDANGLLQSQENTSCDLNFTRTSTVNTNDGQTTTVTANKDINVIELINFMSQIGGSNGGGSGITSDELDNKLSDYTKTSDLNTTLNDYAKTSDIPDTSDFVTNSTLADYIKYNDMVNVGTVNKHLDISIFATYK